MADNEIPDGPIVNVKPASEARPFRCPTDIPEAPLFCVVEVGSGDGQCTSTNTIALSLAGAAALHQELGSLLAAWTSGREGEPS